MTSFEEAAAIFNDRADPVEAFKSALGGKAKEGRSEWHGPCPLDCRGGDDRFVLITKPRGGGNPFGYCRRCKKGADILRLCFIGENGRLPQKGELGKFLRDRGYLDDDGVQNAPSPVKPLGHKKQDTDALLTRLLALLDMHESISPQTAQITLNASLAEVRVATIKGMEAGTVKVKGDPPLIFAIR